MSKVKESQLREYIRQYVKLMMEEEAPEEKEEAPTEEPKEEPKKKEPEEDKSNLELDQAKKAFVSQLNNIPGAADADSMVDTLSDVIEAFGFSNEIKLNLLKAIKTNVIR
jgi:hypothetical protein